MFLLQKSLSALKVDMIYEIGSSDIAHSAPIDRR